MSTEQSSDEKGARKTFLPSPMQYLEKAMNGLHDLGLLPKTKTEEAPIVALLNQISNLDEERVIAISRTLNQASLFNDVVREQVQAMEIGALRRDYRSVQQHPGRCQVHGGPDRRRQTRYV